MEQENENFSKSFNFYKESDYKPGIKKLLSMKNSYDGTIINENINNDEEDLNTQDYDNDDFVEEITDEEYNKNVNEIDDLIRDIMRTKHKLRLGKLKNKIKTKEDFYNFMRIRDGDNNLLPPEPSDTNSKEYMENFKINQNSKINKDYDKIKEKLKKQEENFKKEKEKDLIPETQEHSLFITGNTFYPPSDDLNSIFEEIKKAESRCDDLLEDIDDCIKMGEDIDKIIDAAYNK